MRLKSIYDFPENEDVSTQIIDIDLGVDKQLLEGGILIWMLSDLFLQIYLDSLGI